MGLWKETFIAESRELPLDELQFVGVSGRDKIQITEATITLGLTGVWYSVIK
jgi:hypothetical protein